MKATNEIIIIGGGIIGLAIAIELKLRGIGVTILSRNYQQAATNAAAGMLAPRAEGLPQGEMLDLALASLALYPEWVAKLEQISGEDTDFNPCGIIAPVYQAPQKIEQDYHSVWLDKKTSNIINLTSVKILSVVGGIPKKDKLILVV